MEFLRGRLKFGGRKNNAPFPSAIVLYGGDEEKKPTIDAVPVVRCKDCVHAIKFRSGQVSCGYHDWCRIQVDPDGYCNHGEKDDIDNMIAQGGGDLIDMMEEDDENADGHLGVDL